MEIKPVKPNNGGQQQKDTLDELKASIGNITLSPSTTVRLNPEDKPGFKIVGFPGIRGMGILLMCPMEVLLFETKMMRLFWTFVHLKHLFICIILKVNESKITVFHSSVLNNVGLLAFNNITASARHS